MVTPYFQSAGQIADVAGVAAGAALELGVADRDQAAGLGHLVEVGDALGLGIAVVHQPVLALERRRRVGVERLVAVEQDVALAGAGT